MKNTNNVSKKIPATTKSDKTEAPKRKTSRRKASLPEVQTVIKDSNLLAYEGNDLEQMTPQELISNYTQIENNAIRGRLQQCRILREIRIKFGEDDRRFGEFLSTTILSELPSKTVTRMIQVADFFETKSIDGIAWSSALALAEPRNRPAALTVYKEIVGKDYRPIDVVAKIDRLMERQQARKINRQPTDIIEGKFTTLAETAPANVVVKKIEPAGIPETSTGVRPILSLKSPVSTSANLIPAPENSDKGLSEQELKVAVEVIAKVAQHLSKLDRARLWRAMIRKDEK